MRRTLRDVRSLLSPLDPTNIASEEESELPWRAERDLVMIFSGDNFRDLPQPATGNQGRKHRRPISLIGVATAIVAVIVGAGVAFPWPGSGGTGTAFAATPAPLHYQPEPGSASMVLRAMADRVQQHPEANRQEDSYQHFMSDRWSLNTRVNGTNVTSIVLPTHVELWLAPDGSATTKIRYDLPHFNNAHQRAAWERQGSPGKDAGGTTAHYRPGKYARTWSNAGPPPRELSEFAKWLKIGHPQQNGPSETLVAWEDLSRELVPDSVTRANLLRVVSNLPGLVYDGHVIDRSGRPGLAFSITDDRNGLPTRHVVVVDPKTGVLLAHEDILTTTPGKLNVKIPAVIDYETYLTAEYTASGPS